MCTTIYCHRRHENPLVLTCTVLLAIETKSTDNQYMTTGFRRDQIGDKKNTKIKKKHLVEKNSSTSSCTKIVIYSSPSVFINNF